MTDSLVESVGVPDETVDRELAEYLRLERPTSFFLFAGAGTGKTRSLVTALQSVADKDGPYLRMRGQRIAVITYTNAACDEIVRRVRFTPLVAVSTIHSFLWEQIRGFNSDIRCWIRANVASDISELQELIRKGRQGTKTYEERIRSVESKQRRLDTLDSIKQFIYSPTGDNRGRDSLNHSEVITIGADFLSSKPLMRQLLVSRYPILLIDESQDTNKLLMESVLTVQRESPVKFALGLFGDTMQRIYADGKVDLGRDLPPDWGKPTKLINHRSPRRVLRLINRIRSAADAQLQVPSSDAIEGHVRLFVASSDVDDRLHVESAVRSRMAGVTADGFWSDPKMVKTLILEHHMAAKRMGFLDIFEPLYQIDEFRTGLLDGTLPLMRLFSSSVLPLITRKQLGDEFGVAAIVRRASPLLGHAALRGASVDQPAQISKAKAAVEALPKLWSEGTVPRLRDVLQSVACTSLFEVPESLQPFVPGGSGPTDVGDEGEVELAALDSEVVAAIHSFLDASFDQVAPYAEYVAGGAPFATHQGIKGREFPRVMVVLDDGEARGFMFSYERLFQVKDKTAADIGNERAGNETGIDRTRRLFYVTCSRSQSSLAIVAYSSNPSKVRDFVLREQWFEEREIELVD